MSDPAAESETLTPLNASELAQLFINNRTAVIEGITKHAYGEIISYVGKGHTTFQIYHPLLQSSWVADAQFVADMLSTIQAYFPGTTITFVGLSETNGIQHILFSYTPTP